MSEPKVTVTKWSHVYGVTVTRAELEAAKAFGLELERRIQAEFRRPFFYVWTNGVFERLSR